MAGNAAANGGSARVSMAAVAVAAAAVAMAAAEAVAAAVAVAVAVAVAMGAAAAVAVATAADALLSAAADLHRASFGAVRQNGTRSVPMGRPMETALVLADDER